MTAARTFAGNRPTASIFAPALTPAVLGQLIAPAVEGDDAVFAAQYASTEALIEYYQAHRS